MDYAAVVDMILKDTRTQELISEGDIMSPLWPSKAQDKPSHGFLVFSQAGADSLRTLRRVDYFEDSPPIEKECVQAEPFFFQTEEYADADEYTELYSQVFSFAFAEQLTEEQKNILGRFYQCTQQLFPPCIVKELRHNFSETFCWLLRYIPKN